MDINLRVSFAFDHPAVSAKLNAILVKEADIMSALDNLRTEVQQTRTVAGSAVALLQGLKAKLDEAIASGDPAAIQSLADDLDTSTNALAAAVAANTPAAGGTTPPTDPGTGGGVTDPGGV